MPNSNTCAEGGEGKARAAEVAGQAAGDLGDQEEAARVARALADQALRRRAARMLPGVARSGVSGSAATASIRSRTARASRGHAPAHDQHAAVVRVGRRLCVAGQLRRPLSLRRYFSSSSSPRSSIAAWAAARRATGRRNGEQLT